MGLIRDVSLILSQKQSHPTWLVIELTISQAQSLDDLWLSLSLALIGEASSLAVKHRPPGV